MVAENWTDERAGLLKYLVRDGRPVFHMTLNFPLLPALNRLDAPAIRESWAWSATLPPGAWLGNFVSNHDLAADRPGTRFANEPEKLRAQVAWLLLGPGTPFIYYGNEIGQPQGPQRGDTKHRQPLDWTEMERQRTDPGSIWQWHRQLIRLRHDHPSLRRGKVQFLETDAGPDLMAILREVDGDATLTILSGAAAELPRVAVTLPGKVRGQSAAKKLGPGEFEFTKNGALTLGPIAPFAATLLQLQVPHP
jgi:alpha-glucosidase